jgi:site-specific recombinase XerD
MSKLYRLSEAADILGENIETLKTKSKRGELPTQIEYEGKKPYKVITAETLANLLQNKSSDDYTELKAQWRQEMLAGTHSGTSTPVSEGYLNDLEWGLKKFWFANDGKETVEAVNADSLRKALAQFQFDEESRRDYYSSKMHVYKAISSFAQFLIRKGYKAPSVFDEIKKLRPKARIKPQRHSLDLTEVWEAISFNSHWNDGRTSNDIQTMDLLLFLYGFAGLRRMEAANIKIEGIDFDKSEILVPGKWGKDRFVPIPQELTDKLNEWLKNLRPISNLPYVLVNHNGNKLTEKSISCRFNRLSKALALNKALVILKGRASETETHEEAIHNNTEIELFFPGRSKEQLLEEAQTLAKTLNCKVRPHDLRRAYAKMLAEQGMPLPKIQYVLGHNDIETTMKYINIKQKETAEWIHENLVITLPEKIEQHAATKTSQPPNTPSVIVPTSKPEGRRKFRY